MRAEDQRSEGFFSYVRLETRIPADHPLRHKPSSGKGDGGSGGRNAERAAG
jgi:hypothetical protein